MCSVGTIFAGAFGFGIAFDTLTEKWWDFHNKGVRILTSAREQGANIVEYARERMADAYTEAVEGHSRQGTLRGDAWSHPLCARRRYDALFARKGAP